MKMPLAAEIEGWGLKNTGSSAPIQSGQIKPSQTLAGLIILMIAALLSTEGARASDLLAQGFEHPPAAARPWVYWYFMDGNLTADGMKADLQAMKDAGIGGAIFLEVNIGIERGPVDFMSPPWQDLLVRAIQEAKAQGIQIALAAGPGWCGTGGPWIKPDWAMQDLIGAATNVTGPVKFTGKLPVPPARPPYFGMGTLTPALANEWSNFYRDEAVLAFPAPAGNDRIADSDEKALYYRTPYSSTPGVKPFLAMPAKFPDVPADRCIDTSRIIDLTSKLSRDGHLAWNVPAGDWTIMRFGRRLTGQTTRPAPQPGLGFESDKFDRAALDAHYSAYIKKIIDRVGCYKGGGGLSMLHFDSWEMNSQNWSPDFRAQFKRRRGYDPLPYLPAVSGRIVLSPEISERFLWDLRETAQELTIDNHLGHLKDLAHRSGLKLSIEPYDMDPCADLSMGRVADVPQCEFWYFGFNTFYSAFEAASIAHTGGQSMVAAESFTSPLGEDWKADPAALKTLGDWAFATGVNRFDFHRFQAQPWTNRWPGMTMAQYGVHWDRTQTWWGMARAYHDYLARCQFLLQRGMAVADVCYLVGEGAPHVFRPPASATVGSPPDHLGYNFDGCAPETLLERATVKHGQIVFPGGTSYRILVLPESPVMTPKLLRKVQELARAGATIFGPPPRRSPSLQNYPGCDVEVQKLARQMWGDCDGRTVFQHAVGQGRIVWRQTKIHPGDEYGDFSVMASLLAGMNVPPDFTSDGPIRFAHRHDTESGAEIYFVANREQKSVDAKCMFRVAGKHPELFDPITAESRSLPEFSQSHLRTAIPLHFEPGQSYFIIFRNNGRESAGHNFLALQPLMTLSGPWNVSFDPKWGGPGKISFSRLEDWSQRPEFGVKCYSGTAVYRKKFDIESISEKRTFLELGDVKNLARVRLNGIDLGVVWCPPWRVETTGTLKTGKNRLEIEVANLWPNRLIGDLNLPADKRLTWTTRNPFTTNSPLLPSGLLGPVRIVAETQ